MSIKKLFGSVDKSRNYLAETNNKNAFKDIESAKNMQEIAIKQETFVPQIDYSEPENFAKFGSAELYYKSAMERIIDYYPYDGSDYEFNQFYNKSLDIEKYIFNNLYPRTNGYANFDSSSYIDMSGGPHSSSAKTTSGLFNDGLTSKREFANIYDTDIYRTEGLSSDYGSGTRESNLKANFDTGVTVEFWLKSKDLTTNANSVVFDMWNNNASGTVDSGRLTVEVLSASSGTPFRFTAQSGSISGTLFQQNVGQTITSTTLDSFNHYAFVFQNSGSYFVTKLYLNGYLNDTVTSVVSRSLGELPSKDMQARIGSFLTVPFRADAASSTRAANTHTLTGSIDEFRYWKAARNAEDIGRYWFTHVRGGTNMDISNTTLGVYYKFNEGTTGDNTIDTKVLDYSGRLTNGLWTGTASRTLSSAMVETSASAAEFKDPIIYATHPDVTTLKKGLLSSGSWHDSNNNASFYSLIPSWIMEEHEELGNTNPEVLSHIVGSYFDKIYLQISALTTLKQLQNTSASYSPLPMAQHLPQSLGLYTPELFVDADVLSRFLNRTEDFNFEADLTETKNLIYQNLYNNISHIYKAKGTEKAIRNIFRCFYLDDKIIKFNTYTDNVVYELKNNLQQTVLNKNSLNFNSGSNLNAVVYQKQDPDNTTESRGYISGSGDFGYENIYGFTAEVDVLLPNFRLQYDTFDRNFISCSIFGMHSASVDDSDDTTIYAADNANFQVYAMRTENFSKDVYFKLTSSVSPHPFSDLTSSIFFNAYDDENWNLSVRLRPSNWPVTEIVSGSDIGYTYDVIFQGVNTKLGNVENSFTVSSSVTKAVGQNLLNAAKRMYVGARRTNITGTVLNKSDVLITNTRYWAKYLDDLSLQQHIYDVENVGISGSYLNISPLDTNNNNLDILNHNTLVLDWNFSDLTSSDGTGNFFTQDVSSGSALVRRSYGWMGKLSGYLHSGYGYDFAPNTTNIVDKRSLNTFKFISPEQAVASDMVQILSEDDIVFGFAETIPNYHHTLEKSLSAAISEEMLNFFAGVIDFNNLIGEPVNRYRERYKSLEKLREAFFRRVTTKTNVEDYIKYYQWFDDALSAIVEQFMPAGSKFTSDVLNIVESHALERNKYKSQFPTIEFKATDPIAPALGINEKTYNWKFNHHPVSGLQKDNSNYWRDRERRSGSAVISSGDLIVDTERDVIREAVENDNNQPSTKLATISDGVYTKSRYVVRKLTKPYKLKIERKMSPVPPIRGGANFEHNKKIAFTYNALYPAGPVNRDENVFVPENVLFAEVLNISDGTPRDIVGIKNSTDPIQPRPGDKVKRRVKVQHGRDWYEGVHYQSAKSDIVFPFNIISSSVTTGYNKQVVEKVSASLVITNLHNDVYGDDMEKPMQGPFTEYAVGGHQSRHIKLNTPASDAAAATGYITLAKLPQNNDTITISDGGTSIVFTFKSSPGAASTDVEIDGIFETRGYLRVAINEQDWNIAATETESPAANTVALRNIILGGSNANTAITKTESVSNTYTLSGMAGGVGPRYGLADYRTRPEAWKLLLGYCPGIVTGAIGMVGADYPWPEGNAMGEIPYPMTASQKAVYYRDFVAKRPVNIKNIHHTTGSTVLGNYNHNYDFVQAAGAWANPRQFVDNQPNLPTTIFDEGKPNTKHATSVRTLLDIYRGAIDGAPAAGIHPLTGGVRPVTGHSDFSADYSTAYLEKSTNNSVIISRFAAPGGIEVMSKGYQDFKSGEFSVYNAFNNRNLTVHRPFQHQPTTSASAESNGIRVYDIHGNDMGLYTHTARHTNRFFRDSILESAPGTSYVEKPAFHRVHRNTLRRPGISSETWSMVPVLSGSVLVNEKAAYFTDSELNGSMFLNAESASCTNFLTGARSRGFTYTSWFRMAPLGDTPGYSHLFSVGKNGASSLPFIEISKVSASFQFELATRNQSTGFGGSHTRAQYLVKTTGTVTQLGTTSPSAQGALMNGGYWVHVAVVCPVSAGVNGPSFPSIYFNGQSQLVIENTSPREYFDQKIDESQYSVLNSVPRRGDSVLGFGGNVAKTSIENDALTGALDQVTLWDVALSASEIESLYNSGVPCDVTGSAWYENSSSYLFGWYKLGEGDQTDIIDANGINAKVFASASNAIYNSHTAENHLFPIASAIVTANTGSILSNTSGTGLIPTPITGCAATIIGHSTSVETVYSCDTFYDNLNQFQQIPKSDRQYAWMTGAMFDPNPCSVRYSGYMPIHGEQAGYYSASNGYEPWMTLISASDFGVVNISTTYNTFLGAVSGWDAKVDFVPQDFVGLNTLIYEPISGSTNTLGYPNTVPIFSRDTSYPRIYTNRSFVGQTAFVDGAAASTIIRGTVSASTLGTGFAYWPDIQLPGYMFNSLMLKRNGPYGWGTFNQMRQSDHPILINERSSSQLSVAGTNTSLANYNLPAISMRGRPAIINYSTLVAYDSCGDAVDTGDTSVTLKATDNNQKIFFNDVALNDRQSIDTSQVITPFDHLIVSLGPSLFDENYLIYTENVYPSMRNEFVSSSRRRTNYDNRYWRDNRAHRGLADISASLAAGAIGADIQRNSLGSQSDISDGSGGLKRRINQSSWPLDAPFNFLTRTGSIVGQSTVLGPFTASQRPSQAGALAAVGALYFNYSSSAGELQNEYTQGLWEDDQTAAGLFDLWCLVHLNSTVLYSSKHNMGAYKSVVGGSGMRIPETGGVGGISASYQYGLNEFTSQVYVNAGEALWEAGDHAGIVLATGSKGEGAAGISAFKFQSYKSKPWYNSYSDFREDIRLMAKDYVIVPEYRISNHVRDYSKYGINNAEKFDTFEIPGTAINSTTASFYKDYVNSEKLKYFRSTGEKIPGMTAKEIRISVKAVKKFNPYKGFYPAQRTLDLAEQFSASYGKAITRWYGSSTPEANSWTLGLGRAMITPLFAPGILYNSIKSGLAVDYPVLNAGSIKEPITNYPKGRDPNWAPNLWAIHSTDIAPDSDASWAATGSNWKRGTPYWDQRLPFETILTPEKYIGDTGIIESDPHPSNSLGILTTTCSLDSHGTTDGDYTLMARNFFGEVANFFLKDSDYTTIKSNPIAGNALTFTTGTYGARLRMYRSMAGTRTYRLEYDARGLKGAGSAFSAKGGRKLDVGPGNDTLRKTAEAGLDYFVSGATYELPQDPSRVNHGGNKYTENFTMYSRTTAFGPAVSGRDYNDDMNLSGSLHGVLDGFNGHNWSHTPPYYHGQAWVDFIFRPATHRTYTLQEVLDEIETYYWRVDAGPLLTGSDPYAMPAFISGNYNRRHIFDGYNVNLNSMQISASLNLFGIENILSQEADQHGTIASSRNESKATRWVIKPKFETPMLNFNSMVQPVSDAANTLSIPTFGSCSVPRGMWHQFGIIEPDPDKGIFMSIDDIPRPWLKNHYLINTTASVYNNYLEDGPTAKADGVTHSIRKAKRMKSLVNALNLDTSRKRLGQLANETVVKEAVIAIPYVMESPVATGMAGTTETEEPSTAVAPYKRFFSIPKKRIKAALKRNASSEAGQSLQTAGESIRKLVAKMDNYILPPQFDFLRNSDVDPIVMYIFEFSYTFDQDDLSYIWQNLAPRNYKKVTFEEQAIAHRLNKTQLLTSAELMKDDVRWMIFKVKQRATGDYYEHVPTQVGGALSPQEMALFDPAGAQQIKLGKAFGSQPIAAGEYSLQYNWPYDYLSFVEGIKVDIEILFDDESNRTRSLVRELRSKQTLSYGTVSTVDKDILEIAEGVANPARDPIISTDPETGEPFTGTARTQPSGPPETSD